MAAPTLHRERPTPELPQIMLRTGQAHRIIDGARHLTTEGRKGEVAVHLACVTQLDEVTP